MSKTDLSICSLCGAFGIEGNPLKQCECHALNCAQCVDNHTCESKCDLCGVRASNTDYVTECECGTACCFKCEDKHSETCPYGCVNRDSSIESLFCEIEWLVHEKRQLQKALESALAKKIPIALKKPINN
jgi:hypothetical protein